jgi:hypothetical protein
MLEVWNNSGSAEVTAIVPPELVVYINISVPVEPAPALSEVAVLKTPPCALLLPETSKVL